MNAIKFYADGKELKLKSGIPRDLEKYMIPHANAFHVKVGKVGYMLFQELREANCSIWISHYLFDRPTTIECVCKNDGIEFHHIMQGHVLFKMNEGKWEHLEEGHHNVLYNPKIHSMATFLDKEVSTFDVHISVKDFKKMKVNTDFLIGWMEHIREQKDIRLHKVTPKTTAKTQALVASMLNDYRQSADIGQKANMLMEDYLSKTSLLQGAYCMYNYSFADILKILEIKEKICKDPARQMYQKDLHEKIHMGASKFSQGFKLLFGLPPKAFLLNEKINMAKAFLIQDNDLTNFDISQILHFNSGSHFSTSFKKHTGFTPLEYRIRNGSLSTWRGETFEFDKEAGDASHAEKKQPGNRLTNR